MPCFYPFRGLPAHDMTEHMPLPSNIIYLELTCIFFLSLLSHAVNFRCLYFLIPDFNSFSLDSFIKYDMDIFSCVSKLQFLFSIILKLNMTNSLGLVSSSACLIVLFLELVVTAGLPPLVILAPSNTASSPTG